MGLPESLNTEQAIVSSLQHNDLIKLHLEQHTRHHWQKTKCCWKHNATVLCAPAHLLTRLAVTLRLCAGASTNCSLRSLAALFAVMSLCKGHFSSPESLSLIEPKPDLDQMNEYERFVFMRNENFLKVRCSVVLLQFQKLKAVFDYFRQYIFLKLSDMYLYVLLFFPFYFSLNLLPFHHFPSCSGQMAAQSWGAGVTWIPPKLTLLPNWIPCQTPLPWVMRSSTMASTTSPWSINRSISALYWLNLNMRRQTVLLIM